jgi:hypothetical protein
MIATSYMDMVRAYPAPLPRSMPRPVTPSEVEEEEAR